MSAIISSLNSQKRPPMKDAALSVTDVAVPVAATPVLAVTAVGVAFGIGLLIGAAVR